MTLVTVKETKLLDGSIVFDVVNYLSDGWGRSDGRVIISAVDEKSAWHIADAINGNALAVYGDERANREI